MSLIKVRQSSFLIKTIYYVIYYVTLSDPTCVWYQQLPPKSMRFSVLFLAIEMLIPRVEAIQFKKK